MNPTVDDAGPHCCDVCETPLGPDGRCPSCSTSRRLPEDPLVGRRVDGYLLGEPLGRGAMGIVYTATQIRLGRSVAVKVLPPVHSKDSRRVARFLNEARALSRVSHPNVVTIFDADQSDDLLWIAMERLDGSPLSRLIECGPLDPSRVIRIGVQICDALDAAHRVDVVHRDLKPDNIFVVSHDPETIKVLDFGIASIAEDARSTTPGAVTGTPAYMSPEQIFGNVATPSSDLYSLSVVLYELLAGKRPFDGPTSYVLAAHAERAPMPLGELAAGIPAALAGAVMRGLQKDPEERPPTARAFRAELLAAQPAYPADPPDSPAHQRGRSILTRRWYKPVVYVAAIAAALLVVFLSVWPFESSSPMPSSTVPTPVPVAVEPGESTSALDSVVRAVIQPVGTDLLGKLPEFSAREHLNNGLQQLGVSTLQAAFQVDLDTARRRLSTWTFTEYDVPLGLVELVLELPLLGAERTVEIRLQFIEHTLARIYVRLFNLDPTLEEDLEKKFGQPGESIRDFGGCPAWLWKGPLYISARVFVGNGTWRGLVIAEPSLWGKGQGLLDRDDRHQRKLKKRKDDLKASPSRAAAARADLTALLKSEPNSHAAGVELCRANYDLGFISEARAACEKAREGTRDATTRARADYYLALLQAASGHADSAATRLRELRVVLRGPGNSKDALELLPHVEQRLAGLGKERSRDQVQIALCRRRKFRAMTLPDRAANIALEFGFKDDQDLTTTAAGLGLDELPRGCDDPP